MNIQELTKKIVLLALEKGVMFSIAESLTGGNVTSSIIDVSGASQVLYEGIVSYSNDSKHQRLGVTEEVLSSVGAVSYETACQMAKGLLRNGVDYAVSTTGIAGPTGATKDKPLGLTYIGIATKNDNNAYKFVFGGDRNSVRQQAVYEALNILYKTIKGV